MFEIGAKLDEMSLNEQGKKAEKDARPSSLLPKSEHRLVFTFEKRNGKPVTCIGRFYLSDNDKKALLKLLKKKLACGGKLNEEWLQMQGDCKQQVKEILKNEGWKFFENICSKK